MEGSMSNLKKIMLCIKALFLNLKKQVVKNKKIVAPVGAVVVLLIIVLAVVLSGIGKKDSDALSKTAGTDASVSENLSVPEEALEENAYPEINELINKYYKALADGEMDTITGCRNYTEDTERIRLEKKSQYIEEYRNLTCFTKKGMLENTFLVYVSYEVKFKEIETAAPALNTLYICPNDEGKLYIYEGEIDDNVSNYLQALSSQDDVKELINKVQVSYKEAIAADEKLDTFLAELPTKIKTEVGEALAAAEAGQEGEGSVSGNEAAPEGNNSSIDAGTSESVSGNEAEQPSAPVQTADMVKTLDTVNVRSSDSETADKVGKAEAGKLLKRLEVKENGWSKVEFEGKEAYIKSEFLQAAENTEVPAQPPENNQGTENNAQADNTAPDVPKSPEGMVTAQQTVNVRKSASETADKLGVAYQGDQFELVMKQADGWTKIKYKGQTGFVKSEFVK